MLSFVELIEELSKEEIEISPPEVRKMVERFGAKVLQMGHLQPDGAMIIPVDCVIEAIRALDGRTLSEAIETLKGKDAAAMLRSAESLVEQVGAARRARLSRMIDKFQSDADDRNAHQSWREIEKTIFGVEFRD